MRRCRQTFSPPIKTRSIGPRRSCGAAPWSACRRRRSTGSAATRPMIKRLRGFSKPSSVPEFNPLIAHVPALEMARKIAEFQAAAERLADAFWPGPLTLVLPSADGSPISELARGRPRHDRRSGARPSGHAGGPESTRPPHCRAERQQIRRSQPDDRSACPGPRWARISR